jgi:hypothetical protein
MDTGSLRSLAATALAVVVAAGLATSAMAQSKSQFDDGEEEEGGSSSSSGGGGGGGGGDVVTGTTIDLIIASLQRNGFATELSTDSTGDPIIESTDQDKPFSVQFYGCTDGEDCTFIQFIKGWDMEDGITLAKVEEWNSSKVWGKAYRDDEKDPWLTMPVNLYGGVTVTNFDDTVDWWKVIVGQFEEHIGW